MTEQQQQPPLSQGQPEPESQQPRGPLQILSTAGIPMDALFENPVLYMSTYSIARLLFLYELYQKALTVHGDLFMFGVRWGQDLAWLHHLRVLHEPLAQRRLVGFDTFEGFPSVHPHDGNHRANEMGVTPGYERHLEELLTSLERTMWMGEKYFTLVKGNVIEALPQYLAAHPYTVVAFAYFDLDLYEPTKACLEAIQPFLTKGSILGFDQLNYPDWPGETVALREALGLGRYRIQRTPWSRTISYCVVE